MADNDPRPIFKWASSLGCDWRNIRKAHDEAEKRKRRDLLGLLKRELGERFASDDTNLVVVGSLGRGEWIDSGKRSRLDFPNRWTMQARPLRNSPRHPPSFEKGNGVDPLDPGEKKSFGGHPFSYDLYGAPVNGPEKAGSLTSVYPH